LEKKKAAIVVLVILFLCVTVNIVQAKPEVFTVPPGEEIKRWVWLKEEDELSGKITVLGGSGNDVNFYITDPNGNTILRKDRATRTSFSFKAKITGSYILHFDNTFSWFSSKTVTLEHTISRPSRLSPEVFCIIGVIIGIVIGGAIVAIICTQKRKSEKVCKHD